MSTILPTLVMKKKKIKKIEIHLYLILFILHTCVYVSCTGRIRGSDRVHMSIKCLNCIYW